MKEALATYLNDHLAGANMAVDLLCLLHEHQPEPDLKVFLHALLVEVSEDRDTLQHLVEELGQSPSALKNSAAWLAAQVVSLKLRAGLDPFGTFESLEFLTLGILGKLQLWKALQRCSIGAGTIHVDFVRLIGRAEAQYGEVEKRRLEVAAQVFSSHAETT